MYKYSHRNPDIHTHLGEDMHVQTQKGHIHTHVCILVQTDGYICFSSFIIIFRGVDIARVSLSPFQHFFMKSIRIKTLRFKQL